MNYKRHLKNEHGMSGDDLRPNNQRSIGEMMGKTTTVQQPDEPYEAPAKTTTVQQPDEPYGATAKTTTVQQPDEPPEPLDTLNSFGSNVDEEEYKIPAEPWAKSIEQLEAKSLEKLDKIENKVDLLAQNLQPIKTNLQTCPVNECVHGIDKARTLSDIQKELPFMELKNGKVQCSICIEKSNRSQFAWESS